VFTTNVPVKSKCLLTFPLPAHESGFSAADLRHIGFQSPRDGVYGQLLARDPRGYGSCQGSENPRSRSVGQEIERKQQSIRRQRAQLHIHRPASSVFRTCFDLKTESFESGSSTVTGTSVESIVSEAQNIWS